MKDFEKTNHTNLQYLIGTLIRRRWFFIVPLVFAFILSAVLAFVLPKQYEATSTILVSNKKIIDPLISEFAVAPDIAALLDTLSKRVLSWDKMKRLVAQFDMAEKIESPEQQEDFIEDLKRRITVGTKGKEFVQISYGDNDPKRAQEVVKAITTDFIQENSRIQKEEADSAIEFLNHQLKIYRTKLEHSQGNFSASKINSELRLAQNRKKLLKDMIDSIPKVVPSTITMEKDPVLAQLNAQLGEFEAELAFQMIDAKEKNPKVIELRGIIKELKKRIEQEKERETIKESISVINPFYLKIDQELKQVNMDIDYLENRKTELVKAGYALKEHVTEEELVKLERDKKVDEDIYQMLLKQLEAAYVSKRLQDSEDGGRFTIVEDARLPLKPVKPNKFKVIFMGMFLGICAGSGLIFSAEYMDRSFLTVDEAKDYLPLPVLGSISRMIIDKGKTGYIEKYLNRFTKEKKIFSMVELLNAYRVRRSEDSPVASQVVFYHEPQSRIAEEYRVLRTNLLGHDNVNIPKIIMVSSTVRGEGKSTTAANLAVAMATSNKSTLLVDCDLRKGSINDMFGVIRSPGFSDVLQGFKGHALMPGPVKNLHIMPRGDKVPNPSELLSYSRLNELFGIFKNRFEVIILDGPPVLNLADSCIMGRYADETILVVQMERTQRDDVLSSQAELARSGANVAGFVLTSRRYYIPRYIYSYYYGDLEDENKEV